MRLRLIHKSKLWTFAPLMLVFAMLACQFGPAPSDGGGDDTAPAEFTPVEQTPEDSALPTTDPNIPTPTPAPPPPTTSPGLALGTVMLDEIYNLDSATGQSLEITFESGALQTISIEANLVGGTTLEYEMQLFDMFGNSIAQLQSTFGRTLETLPEFTLPYEGQYLLTIAPIEGSGSLQVSMRVVAPSGGGILETSNDASSGHMGETKTYHTYQFVLVEGDTVTISARANVPNRPDLRLLVYGPDGRYIIENDDEDKSQDKRDAVVTGFIPQATGTYTVIVTNYGESLGAYIFDVTSDTIVPEAVGDPDIVYDNEYRVGFADGDNLSLSFDGSIGDVLQVSVFDLEADLDVDIYLISPYNQIFAVARDSLKGEDEVLYEVQLPYTGRYHLEIRPIGAGQASLKVAKLSQNVLTGGGVFGDENSGTLQGAFQNANVNHIYQFNATVGDTITLAVTSISEVGDLDIGFAVLGPDGLQYKFADQSNGDNPNDPAITFTVNQTGTYTVIVYTVKNGLSFATGFYQMSFLRE